MTDKSTLGSLAAAGRAYGVTVWCEPCRRGLSIPIGTLVALRGAAHRAVRSSDAFRCGRCDRKATSFGWQFREEPHVSAAPTSHGSSLRPPVDPRWANIYVPKRGKRSPRR